MDKDDKSTHIVINCDSTKGHVLLSIHTTLPLVANLKDKTQYNMSSRSEVKPGMGFGVVAMPTAASARGEGHATTQVGAENFVHPKVATLQCIVCSLQLPLNINSRRLFVLVFKKN